MVPRNQCQSALQGGGLLVVLVGVTVFLYSLFSIYYIFTTLRELSFVKLFESMIKDFVMKTLKNSGKCKLIRIK